MFHLVTLSGASHLKWEACCRVDRSWCTNAGVCPESKGLCCLRVPICTAGTCVGGSLAHWWVGDVVECLGACLVLAGVLLPVKPLDTT